MKNNILIDISPPIPYLEKFWFSGYWLQCYQPIKLQDSLKCNISRKKWMMNYFFSMQINIEVSYKLILSLWLHVSRHVQSNQISLHIFAISLEKHDGWSWCFLRADKHKNFIQVESTTLGVLARHVQSIQNKLTISLQYLKETWKMKLVFCLLINDFFNTFILDVCGQTCPNYPK